jgi:hypothetical protein
VPDGCYPDANCAIVQIGRWPQCPLAVRIDKTHREHTVGRWRS